MRETEVCLYVCVCVCMSVCVGGGSIMYWEREEVVHSYDPQSPSPYSSFFRLTQNPPLYIKSSSRKNFHYYTFFDGCKIPFIRLEIHPSWSHMFLPRWEPLTRPYIVIRTMLDCAWVTREVGDLGGGCQDSVIKEVMIFSYHFFFVFLSVAMSGLRENFFLLVQRPLLVLLSRRLGHYTFDDHETRRRQIMTFWR